LIDINENDALAVAEKIRENVQNNKIKIPDGHLTKTISLGISEFPCDAETFWKCIKFADVALYQAKERGRNMSIKFSKEMWTEDQI
jgi:diguanylate cyclase (GGDEF)-like protein